VPAATDLGNLREELKGAGAPGIVRANPMALEVRVNATGALPGAATEKRELFSEDTKTALVFPDAAVIALSATVVPGQLIFLTNKQNNREVVCQVVQKRNNQPTGCYVELQFTEPQPDFWGVVFPKNEATAAVPAPREKFARSAGTAEPVTETVVAEPNAEEVELLKREVDALREQLKTLTEAKMKEEEATIKAAEAAKRAKEVAKKAEEAAAAAKREAEAKPLIKMSLPAAPAMVATSGNAPVKPETAPLSPVPTKMVPSAPAIMPKTVATPEPAARSAARDAYEDLLPEPELDFSHAPIPVKGQDDDDRYSIYKPLRKEVGLKQVIITISATLLVLAAGLGYAWYKDLLPMARRNAESPIASVKGGTAGKPAASEAGEAKNKSVAANAEGATATPADTTSGKAGEKQGAQLVAGTENETTGDSPAAPSARDAAPKTNGAKRVGGSSRSGVGAARKRGTPGTTLEAAAKEPEPAAADGPFVAAKLLKAGKPVYPPEAMRNFITGDVRINAEVEADGHVGKMTVISGPAGLRDAAVEAMKQYEYEPATRGGRVVASQVTVTIKFWFDP
jgi:TonB family protein